MQKGVVLPLVYQTKFKLNKLQHSYYSKCNTVCLLGEILDRKILRALSKNKRGIFHLCLSPSLLSFTFLSPSCRKTISYLIRTENETPKISIKPIKVRYLLLLIIGGGGGKNPLTFRFYPLRQKGF